MQPATAYAAHGALVAVAVAVAFTAVVVAATVVVVVTAAFVVIVVVVAIAVAQSLFVRVGEALEATRIASLPVQPSPATKAILRDALR